MVKQETIIVSKLNFFLYMAYFSHFNGSFLFCLFVFSIPRKNHDYIFKIIHVIGSENSSCLHLYVNRFSGWAGSYGRDSCACGVNGNCHGGREALCNCDSAGNKEKEDAGVITQADRLPVCQVRRHVVEDVQDNIIESVWIIGNIFTIFIIIFIISIF